MTAPIVVGIDFSPASRRTVQEATRLALLEKAPLILVHASSAPHLGWAASEEHLDAIQQVLAEAQMSDVVELSNEWARPLRQQGLEVETVNEEGRPADLMRQVARERGASLIVVGHHGWGALKRLLLGSVAKELLDPCPVPVLVVPEPARS